MARAMRIGLSTDTRTACLGKHHKRVSFVYTIEGRAYSATYNALPIRIYGIELCRSLSIAKVSIYRCYVKRNTPLTLKPKEALFR